MSRARLSLGATLVALATALLAAAPACAVFGPFQLLSRTVTQQADAATAPALSADGRFIAFQATNFLEAKTGVFWKDLGSGAVVAVATGSAIPPNSPGAEASAASISADGRYVSFTTKAALDPANDTVANSFDAYVADMSTVPPSYELASVAPGSTTAIGGVTLAPRVALSADGRKLAFVSGGQVYRRDLDTDETILVSVSRDPETGAMKAGVPVPGGGAVAIGGLEASSGAALSADGTTVAWLGAHLPAQVPLLADEKETISQLDNQPIPYDEPLWRRVADGPAAPTRRIVGGGDPLAPGCPGTAGTLADPACRGPYPAITDKEDTINAAQGWMGVVAVDGVPQLSADGRTVALIGNPTEATNVFLVDMAPGLSRVAAVRQLTAQVPVQPNEGSHVNRPPYLPLNAHVYDLSTSADGRRIAFTTARQQFPLAPPNLVSQRPSALGLVEVYLIDLETESVQRVTHGYGGEGEASLGVANEDAQGGKGAASPSLTADGRLLAFSSTAWNLAEGDGNGSAKAGGADVFLSADEAQPVGIPAATISPQPRAPRAARRRRLALSAFSLPSGAVKLVAVAPAAGRLQARAKAPLRVGARPRPLARGKARAKANKPVALTLALPRRYRRLAHSREGIYATVRVAFRGRSGKRLHGRLQVRFRAHRGGSRGGGR